MHAQFTIHRILTSLTTWDWLDDNIQVTRGYIKYFVNSTSMMTVTDNSIAAMHRDAITILSCEKTSLERWSYGSEVPTYLLDLAR